MELVKMKTKDFCCFDESELQLRDMGLVWVGGVNEDTKAADNNGCGKSTIFKALTWGLYGKTIDGERGDKIIRAGQKKAEVTITFEDESHDMWTVKRTREAGVPRVSLIDPGGKEFPASKDEVQERINSMMGGLDFSAFKNTVLYGQNDSSRFADPKTKDVDRKDMLHKILRTELLGDCHNIFLNRRKDVKTDIKELQTRVEIIEAKVGAKDMSALKRRINDWKVHNETEVKGADEEATVKTALGLRLMSQAKSHKPNLFKNEIKEAEQTIRDLQPLADELPEHKDKHLKLSELAVKVDKAITSKSVALATWTTKLEATDESLAQLDGSECPLCTSPLNEGEGGDHKKHLVVERKMIRAKRNKLTRKRAQLELKAEKISVLLKDTHKEVGWAISTIEEIRGLEKSIAKYKADAAVSIAGTDVLVERARAADKDAAEARKRAKEVRQMINPHIEAYAAAKKEIIVMKAEISSIEEEMARLSDEMAYIEFWVRGFSSQGLPSYLLDGVMPYITERANHYLATLSDGDISMHFSTQRELKSSKGEFRDNIDISWVIEGVDDSYPPSGGQLKKMEIATDLALMDLVSSREGGGLNILAMDEILDGLDAEGRNRVLDLLRELRTKRGSVFVISHESDMAELFERNITVTKNDGVSRLEVS